MRIAIVGQQKFGKSVLEAFLERGDSVAGVFCAPDKPDAAPDPLRIAAEQRGIPCSSFPRSRTPMPCMPCADSTWISASWRTCCNSLPRSSPPFRATARFSSTPPSCRATAVRAPSTGPSSGATPEPGSPSFGRPTASTRGRSCCKRRRPSVPMTRSEAFISSGCFRWESRRCWRRPIWWRAGARSARPRMSRWRATRGGAAMPKHASTGTTTWI